MLEKTIAFAKRHPSLFSGAWFAVAALLLTFPFGAMVFVLLTIEALGGRPTSGYAVLMCVSVGLPLIPAFGMGAITGPKILRLPPKKHVHAAGWGVATALGALLIWVLLLEGLPRLFSGSLQATGGGGDVPGAAVAVGYLVVLPFIVALSLLMGAAAGILLQEFVSRSTESGKVNHGAEENSGGTICQ